MATIQRGWALAEQGAKEGITQMYQGLAAQRATGAGIGRTRFLALLVEGYRKGGQIEEALAIVSEALEVGYRTGERNCEAELYRLKGELLLAQEIKSQKSKGKNQKAKIPSPQSLTLSPQAEAEAYFLKAIDIARHQQAKSWELRASTSLARLWQSQGKKKEAHKLLTEIYGWFTEGFDTKDLQEAKALIEEVSY
jgi:predicted ATPase